jgi:hypothetical protein
MFAEYEIIREGSKFIVTHTSGMKVLEFRTLRSAKAEIAQLANDAAMLKTAQVFSRSGGGKSDAGTRGQ